MTEVFHVDESSDAKILGGPVVTDTTRANQVFAEWLIGDGRMQFARNFVNRVWKIYFGQTFVEPVDAFSASNPASHPELLDWLTDQFIESKFNITSECSNA